MKQYLNLIEKILEEGVDRSDRTGTGRKSIFGHQMHFDLQEGFPLVTTKKVHLKSIIHELIWFIAGSTNIKYLKDKGETVQDVDFFFNPRDFPILKKNNMEPYDQIYPEKKLDNEYIHKSYTPILSQSGHTDYHDIPIPTEDDMMRITKNIYPDSCSNKYSENISFEMDWDKKKKRIGH